MVIIISQLYEVVHSITSGVAADASSVAHYSCAPWWSLLTGSYTDILYTVATRRNDKVCACAAMQELCWNGAQLENDDWRLARHSQTNKMGRPEISFLYKRAFVLSFSSLLFGRNIYFVVQRKGIINHSSTAFNCLCIFWNLNDNNDIKVPPSWLSFQLLALVWVQVSLFWSRSIYNISRDYLGQSNRCKFYDNLSKYCFAKALWSFWSISDFLRYILYFHLFDCLALAEYLHHHHITVDRTGDNLIQPFPI